MRIIKRIGLVTAMFLLLITQANAVSILVADSGGTLDYGYGYFEWDNFSAALDTASGGGVVVAPDFTNLAQMLTFDALLLDQRWSSGSLGASEAANIATFIGTGRRVLMMGENNAWSSWNNQILGIVGGTYGGGYTGTTNSILVHELTAGAPTLQLPTAGAVATGGTALYDQNFATLWGASNNVLTVLDVNVWMDSNWNISQGGVFGTNVANWLAGTNSTPIPEPATLSLLGMGLVGLVARARRNKKEA